MNKNEQGTALFSQALTVQRKGHLTQMRGSQRHNVRAAGQAAGNLGKGQQRESRKVPEGRRGGPPALLEEGSGSACQIQAPCQLWEGGLVLRWQMVDGHTL